MAQVPEVRAVQYEETVSAAREQFRLALLKTREPRTNVGDVEAAAAKFCQALRKQGRSPQGMLIDAKKVIEDTIDGEHVSIAERAITSCIQHYFRPEDGQSL